jgi:tetratricopeptide (TPR) repeat protein
MPSRPTLLLMALLTACLVGAMPARGAPVLPFVVGDLPLPSAAVAGGSEVGQGFRLARQGDLPGAEAAFKAALAAQPQMAEAQLGLAEVSLRQGKVAQAESHARAAAAAKPGAAPVWVALGNVLVVATKLDDAEAALRRAIELDASLVPAHMGLGELLLRGRKRPADAAQSFLKATTLAPSLAAAHFALGTAYATDKALDRAVPALERAAKLAPGDPLAAHTLGRVLAAQKRFDEAVRQFGRALQIDAEYRPARLDRADVLAEMERNADSTVTDLARLRGLSTSVPRAQAV